MNSLGNYIAKAYSISNGCVVCQEDTITLDSNVNYFKLIIKIFKLVEQFYLTARFMARSNRRYIC